MMTDNSISTFKLVTERGTIVADNLSGLYQALKAIGEEVKFFYTEEKVYEHCSPDSVWLKERVWDWKIGAPKISGFLGPMKGRHCEKDCWRYETQRVYNVLST